MIRAGYSKLSDEDQRKALEELFNEITDIRHQSGALSDNHEYRALFREARQVRGIAYLSKLYIDSKLFSHYEKVFRRWPHVKLHALVVFDGQSMEDLRNILEFEGMLFKDVQLLLNRSREAHKKIDDFRQRSPEDYANLQSYLRGNATGVFCFLESYLNGLAYDCFISHHDQLSPQDHDLLGEWDSTNKRISYVSFKTKVFCYRVVVAKMQGVELDLSGCEFAQHLAGYGKDVRNALTHPSYYIDPKKGFQEKLFFVTGVNLALVEQIFAAAQEYVKLVESSLGRDAKQSVPWLLRITPIRTEYRSLTKVSALIVLVLRVGSIVAQ